MSIFDKAVDRRNSNADKWSKELIKDICGNPNADAFWVADMDLATSPLIKEVLQKETDLEESYRILHETILNGFDAVKKEIGDTIKAHSEYHGARQTELTRCKVVSRSVS